ncbi:formyltetrahydrofolate deformylase [Flagellimonas halotolerans]|uniref:Formyltetrahydrofolate deformylase n=1 Tax=Flagellimonas halotolerans TaxID=3112164 RepID=A0ABU6IPL2_9FLAO|nr:MULTISPECIES: formyltetrahydrofolate deformylase [unclassified Allomuricauda]MEC3965113.1 formyltetrahydrofolate deformylase [Muricauda sp. SYSU M86414]MEC4265042.1 formyltetrahydrofolate deformylase [Muricauda sp. SYSU M84420]
MKLTILINCPDQSGIIRSVTTFIHQQKGNVVYLDQHVDKQAGVFFMRLKSEFEQDLDLPKFKMEFGRELAEGFNMEWDAYTDMYRPKMAIFVSKYNHCLYDLLSRYNSGELSVEIPFILSNHKDLEYVAEQFNIPYFHIPVTKENKAEAEDKQLELLGKYGVDFIVLARYMQIVSPKVIDEFPQKIINIHHSFLPAFAGAKPYHAAFNRGVKIIGATSHYVTEDLDAGPIIEQDVTTVSHTHSVKDFIAKGRDLERIVLSRAVQLHVARKTMVYNNKTVIFS